MPDYHRKVERSKRLHPSYEEPEVPQTAVREHAWKEIKVTPVTVMRGVNGSPITLSTPGEEATSTIGCFTCNMGLDEGFDVECPGQDLFDED